MPHDAMVVGGDGWRKLVRSALNNSLLIVIPA
jgi:hypothetical protein